MGKHRLDVGSSFPPRRGTIESTRPRSQQSSMPSRRRGTIERVVRPYSRSSSPPTRGTFEKVPRQGLGSMSLSSLSPRTVFEGFLANLGLPHGLLMSVLECYNSCHSMVWLLDNSSYMKVRDSHVIVCPMGGGDGTSHKIECRNNVSRWHELRDCVSFHSHMATKCWIPMKLWLANVDDDCGHGRFSLCCGNRLEDVPDEVTRLKSALKHATLAQDRCPLAAQVHKIGRIISDMAPTLNVHDQTVTFIICTQGLPTDERGRSTHTVQREFWSELKALSKLPVRTIIRLCTDDKRVSNAYKFMHGRIESMDVLDDDWGEVCMS